jgi:hypothetical protein
MARGANTWMRPATRGRHRGRRLVVAALSFGFDHGFPTDTIGMLELFAAGLLLERRPVARPVGDVVHT